MVRRILTVALLISSFLILGIGTALTQEYTFQSLEELVQEGIIHRGTIVFEARVVNVSIEDAERQDKVRYDLDGVRFIRNAFVVSVRSAMYTRPKLEFTDETGTVWGISSKVPSTGHELKLQPGNKYIFFSNSPFNRDNPVWVFRVEPINNESAVQEAIASAAGK